MANRTVKEASTIKGTNPQYLVEKIIRLRVYESRYWKEECFALTAELLVDKAVAIRYIGGIYSGIVKPTPFLCLLVKMLQIQPEKEIIMEFIKQEEFKYMRLLGAIYLRLTATSLETYKYLEPLLNDYRKVRRMNKNGHFELTYIDEVIDQMLHDERIMDITLPRLQKRYQLEENNELDPRISLLDEDLAAVEEDEAGRTSSSSEEDGKDDRRRRSGGGGGGGSGRRRDRSESSGSESDNDRRRRHRHDRDLRRRRKSRSRSRSHDRHRRDRDEDSRRHHHHRRHRRRHHSDESSDDGNNSDQDRRRRRYR